MQLPKQRISYSYKSKNDFQWAKDTIDAILTSSHTSSRYDPYSDKMLSNYQLYNNIVNQEDFRRECNPLNIDIGQFRDIVQPYNKTYNKIQVLLSEELKRPMVFKTVLVNSDAVKSKMAYRDELIKQYIQTSIDNVIASLNNKELQSPSMDPSQIDQYMRTTFLDHKEIAASKILQYLNRKLDIDSIKMDAFKHGLISGYEIVHVSRQDDEPCLKIVNPLNFFYSKGSETKYIQDGFYAGTKYYYTPQQVLDEFSPYMTDQQIQSIEDKYFSSSRDNFYNQPNPYQNILDSSNEGSYGSNSHNSTIMVSHVEWKSYRKVGFLSFVNEFGDTQTSLVSEDFSIPKEAQTQIVTKSYGRKCKYYYFNGMTLFFDYVQETWQGTKIASDIYVKIGPKEDQFRSMDDPFESKLGYHGVLYSAMNATPISLMDRMKPFQYLYFIVMHKLKKLIALDQGKVFRLDYSTIDPKLGLEKTMYFLKEMNLDIYNSLANADQPGASQRGKQTGAEDMSVMSSIMGYINLLASIDQQISDTAGITRQREGQMLPTDAVGNTQASIQMSSAVTEIFFHIHYSLWASVFTSLLSVASSCYRQKGITKQFILDDATIATLEISSDDMQNSDFGVFISSSLSDNDVFKSLQSIAADLIRSTRASFSDLIALYTAKSTEELKNTILQSERKSEELQRQQQEMQMQIEQDKNQVLKDIAQASNDTKIQVAEIQSLSRIKDQDYNDNQIPDQLEIEKLRLDKQYKDRELDLKQQEIDLKELAIKNKSTKE